MSKDFIAAETPIAALFQSPPNRKSSQTTTLCSPTSIKKKSFSSTASSSRRSSSTPLADRFMSIHQYPPPCHQEEDEEKVVVFTTPDNSQQNDQPLLCTSPPPPPLFLSYDPALEIQRQQYCSSPPRKKKRHHHSCCCSYNKCEKKMTTNKSHHRASCEKKRHHLAKEKSKHKKIKNHQVIQINNENVTKKEVEQQQKSRRIGCCFLRKWKQKDTTSASRRRLNGCFCFCGRREWVIFTFILVVVAFILAFVFWPRTPLIRIEGAMRTAPTKVTQTKQGISTSLAEQQRMGNVAFESIWLLNITMDNRRNYLPTRFNRIQIFAKDAMTGLLIGKGIQNEFGQVYLPGHTISTIQLPISINYQARERSDTTFSNLLRACTNMTLQQEHHHSLPIHFWFTWYIFGLDWLGYKPSLIATPATGGFICPS